MAEKPDGRRTPRRWTDWVALSAQGASLVYVIQQIIDRWVLHV